MNNQKTQSVKNSQDGYVGGSIYSIGDDHSLPDLSGGGVPGIRSGRYSYPHRNFAFGPVAGITLTIVTLSIQGLTVSSVKALYGIIMHILATSALVLVAGLYTGEIRLRNRQ